MMRRAAWLRIWMAFLGGGMFVWMGMSSTVWGQVSVWKIGGAGHTWREWGTFFSIEDALGALQPMYFRPDQNVCTSIGKWYELSYELRRALEEGQWKVIKAEPDWRDGWPGTQARGGGQLVDGDPNSAYIEAKSKAFAKPQGVGWLFDLGTGIPINRLRFYPRQEGEDVLGPFVAFYSKGWEFLASDGSSALEVLVANPGETSSLVDVSFPRQFVRYFRWENTAEEWFEVAEIELYGEGFVRKAKFESEVIDLTEPVNFGRLVWAQSVWESREGVLYPVSGELPVSVRMWTRSGTDPTPYCYYRIGDTGEEEEVEDKKAYDRLQDRIYVSSGQQELVLLPPVPGQKGSIQLDREHWSFWSVPYEGSGEPIRSPDACQYFQFKVVLQTEDPDVMVRLDSLVFEYSRTLADAVVGEVAVAGDPSPSRGGAVAVPGELTAFTYDVKAHFSDASQAGFDSLQIDLPSWVEFDSLEVGKGDSSLTVARGDLTYRDGVYQDLVSGDSIYVDTSYPDRLVVYFPSEAVTPGSWDRVRVTFRTSILVYGTRLTGRVWRSGLGLLSQSILEGNASDEVGTDQLQVLLEEGLERGVLGSVRMSTRIMTPNGDGANDEVILSYTLLRLTGEADVAVEIYDLSGRLVRQVYKGAESSGVYDRPRGAYASKVWGGRSEDGHLVLPGVYVVRIAVHTDQQTDQTFYLLSVVY